MADIENLNKIEFLRKDIKEEEKRSGNCENV